MPNKKISKKEQLLLNKARGSSACASQLLFMCVFPTGQKFIETEDELLRIQFNDENVDLGTNED